MIRFTMHAKPDPQSLQAHLDQLQAAGELLRVSRPVDPDVNMSALAHQALVERGKACLFENIRGAPGWLAASQLVADRRKWGLALGVPEAQVIRTLNERVRRPIAAQMGAGAHVPVQEVIQTGDAVDLSSLPAMWTSERDPGRYIASGMCIIRDPETGIRNMSVHRAQVLDRNRTGYYMLPRQAWRIFQMYVRRGEPMPAAMVIGGHPLVMFAAGFVAPFGQDELSIAGGLLGEPVRLARCVSVDLEVPAEAELVLEGEIVPGDEAPEGPFGEVTGTYSQEGVTPVFRVKALTRRRRPIFYALTCGQPPSDAHSITCVTVEVKLFEHLSAVDGGRLDLRDIRCVGGMSPMLVALQLRGRDPGQVRSALMAAASSPYLHPKFIVAVDEDIDISDPGALFWAIGGRLDASKDLSRIDRTRVFTLDNASPLDPGTSSAHRVGTKMLLDATLPWGTAADRRDALNPCLPPGALSLDLESYLG
jgi:2,5-furandicarboxylate decarboxylase 1